MKPFPIENENWNSSPVKVNPAFSVSYDRSGARTGYAEGTVTIRDREKGNADDYVLYWGDENGKLPGFHAIDTVAHSGSRTDYTMCRSLFIPARATRLLVYGSTGGKESQIPAEFRLPDGTRFPEESPLCTFNVISDTHIQSGDSDRNPHLAAAFQDIMQNDPGSVGIFLVGDMVDQGFDENYEKFFSILDANTTGLPPLRIAMGNHEFIDFSTENPYRNADDGKLQRWLSHTGHSLPYSDLHDGGCHFILLGSENYSGLSAGYTRDYCELSDAQLKWLTEKLEETKNREEPVFLFLHQPMRNTVAGSFDPQGWDGVRPEQEEKLRRILRANPRVILFNGHTHWMLEAEHAMYDGAGDFASIFNTASVAYLWSDADKPIEGGQGLYVEVYRDRVLVKGRSYTDAAWIPKAFFAVDRDEKRGKQSVSI